MTDTLNLIDTIANQEKFSTFSKLMASSGVNEIFSGPGAFTVFVPTNDAFAKVPEARLSEFLNETNHTKLKELLSYHILPIKVMAANIGSTPTRKSFTGEDLTFADTNGLKVNGASVQARNIEATNGVVHGLDTVLTPGAMKPAAIATAAGATAAIPLPLASVTGTAIPTPAASDARSAVPTSPSAAEARADIKPII